MLFHEHLSCESIGDAVQEDDQVEECEDLVNNVVDRQDLQKPPTSVIEEQSKYIVGYPITL